jgi:uncharacterized protein
MTFELQKESYEGEFMKAASRSVCALLLAVTPLVSSCQVREEATPMEFRLQAATVTDIFGQGASRDLARAAAAGKSEDVTRLVRTGADPNARGKEGLTPLFWGIMANSADGVRALIRVGANPNLAVRMNNNGIQWDEYPVVVAARTGKTAVLKALLEGGGDPESTSYRTSALHAAASCLECVQMLVERGANVNRRIPEQGNFNVATAAVASGHLEVVVYLLDHGFSIELDKLAWDVQDLGGQENTDPQKAKIVAMIKAKGVEPFVPEWARKK